jgi:hypothetical protein
MPELETLLGRGLIRRTGADFVDLSTIEAIDSVATEAARLAIVQTAAWRGRCIRQTGGDTAGHYIADGAGGWQRIGDARERDATHVDVRSFGAACNGTFDDTSGTDDTAAVRAAVQSCQTTGRTLYIPGVCKITDEIICNGRIRIEGMKGRPDLSGLHQATNAARCLVFAPNANGLPQAIRDMTLKGGLVALDWSGENGAVITHGELSTMERIVLWPNGIGGDNSKGLNIGISMLGCRHSGIFIQGGFDYGIYAGATPTDILGESCWNAINISGGAINSIRSIGAGAPACVWQNAIFTGCQGAGLYVRDADFTLIGCHFEANGGVRDEPDIYMTASGAGVDSCRVRLFSCYFSGKGPAQSDNRITFNSSHCQLTAHDTFLVPPYTINVSGAGTACSIEWNGLAQPNISSESAVTVWRNSVAALNVRGLEADTIAANLGTSIAVNDPISGVLEFVHGTPSTDLRPGIAANANARTLAMGINVSEIGGTVDSSYDSAALRLETRSSSGLFTLLGAEAGDAVDVLFKLGMRGYVFRHGAMAVAAATGNRTINKGCGSIRIAAGQQTAVLTNDLIKSGGILNTQVYAQLMTDDATAKSVVVTRGVQAATFKLNAAATAEVEIAWSTQDCVDDVTGGGGIYGGQLDFSRAINSGHI